VLDAATVRARVDGVTLPLSPKEFALLWTLGSRVGEAITRPDILREVWGTTQFIDPQVVDQYVRYLRRKLEPHDPGLLITTVRGVGYKMELAP